MTEAELAAMLAHDEGHWWYRGRRRIVCEELADCSCPARPAQCWTPAAAPAACSTSCATTVT